MLRVTPSASAELHAMLDDVPPGAVLRFVLNGDDLELRLDRRRPNDEAYEYAGRIVLVVEPEMAEQLGPGRVLDAEMSRDGVQLVLSTRAG